MFHVRRRRRLAWAVTAAAIAAAAASAVIILRMWSPSALEETSRRALADASGFDVVLDGGLLDASGAVTFERATFSSGGRELATVEPLEIVFAGGVLDEQRLVSIKSAVWKASLDLTRPAEAVTKCKELARLAGRLAAFDATGFGVTGPPGKTIRLEIDYWGGEKLAYEADLGCTDGKEEIFSLKPRGQPAGKDWSLTAAADGIRLRAPTESDEPLARLVVMKDGEPVLDYVRSAGGGVLRAVWDARGERVDFAREDGWPVEAAAIEALGFPPATGMEVAARVNSFGMCNGVLESVEGSFHISSPAMSSRRIAAWLAAAGIRPFPEAPRSFENVRIAGRFEVKGSTLSVSPQSDKLALVWAEVDGEAIVLFNGSGTTTLDAMKAAAAEIPERDEPPAVEAPAGGQSENGGVSEGERNPPADETESGAADGSASSGNTPAAQ